jgi:ABC-type multidrug transport system fused ATPase/permease subunit
MSPTYRLWAWMAPHRALLVLSAALLIVNGAMPGAAVWLLHEALAVLRLGGSPVGYSAGFAALFAASGVIRLVRTAVSKGMSWQVVHTARVDVQRRLLEGTHDRAGQLAVVSSDLDDLQYAISAGVTALRNPLTLAVLFVAAAWVAPQLAWLALVCTLPLGVGAWAAGVLFRRRVVAMHNARSLFVDLTREQLDARTTLQAHLAEATELQRFATASSADVTARIRLDVVRQLPSVWVLVVASASVALMLVYGGFLVSRGSLQVESLVTFVVAMALTSSPLRGLSEVIALYQRAVAAAGRAERLLSLPASDNSGGDLPVGPLSIEWRGVLADYGPHRALDGASLEVRAGEWVALVGVTGGGKTTLLRTLLGFVEPSGGQVRLQGRPLAEWSRRSLRGRAAWVRQDDVLLNRSIGDNLRLGAPSASEQQLWGALDAAGAGGWVRGLPGALNHLVDAKGENLSGGQRQRLVLARALVRQPGILIVDEGTSQVDAETSGALVQTLQQLVATRLTVTHDLTLAQHADRIAVMADGRIVEVGSHAALLAKSAIYARLWYAMAPKQAAK